jgi:hypothetical protein
VAPPAMTGAKAIGQTSAAQRSRGWPSTPYTHLVRQSSPPPSSPTPSSPIVIVPAHTVGEHIDPGSVGIAVGLMASSLIAELLPEIYRPIAVAISTPVASIPGLIAEGRKQTLHNGSLDRRQTYRTFPPERSFNTHLVYVERVDRSYSAKLGEPRGFADGTVDLLIGQRPASFGGDRTRRRGLREDEVRRAVKESPTSGVRVAKRTCPPASKLIELTSKEPTVVRESKPYEDDRPPLVAPDAAEG